MVADSSDVRLRVARPVTLRRSSTAGSRIGTGGGPSTAGLRFGFVRGIAGRRSGEGLTTDRARVLADGRGTIRDTGGVQSMALTSASESESTTMARFAHRDALGVSSSSLSIAGAAFSLSPTSESDEIDITRGARCARLPYCTTGRRCVDSMAARDARSQAKGAPKSTRR